MIEDVAEVVLFESASRPRKRTSKAVIPVKAPLEEAARKPHQEARPASSSGQSREEGGEERMGMQQKKMWNSQRAQRSIIGTKGSGRRGRYWKARRQEPSRRVEESVKRKKKEWVVKEARGKWKRRRERLSGHATGVSHGGTRAVVNS